MIRNLFRLVLCILFLIPISVACDKPLELATQPPFPTYTYKPPTPTIEPSPTSISARGPISAAEVKDIASAFETITNLHAEAWNNYDLQTLQSLYSDDVEFIEASFGDHLVGKDKVIEMARGMSEDFPLMRRIVIDQFIGLEDSIATYDYWGVFEFTPDDPFFNAFKYKTKDERITNWTLYEGLEAADKINLGRRLQRDAARSLLSGYQSAWSSGDPRLVADLYSSKAVRKDTIFNELQEGNKAIVSFAESFFAWYPKAEWSQLQAFGEWRGESPVTGGIFSVEVADTANQPCEILVAVLLQASEGKITSETIYYEPDSLIKCGWAK